MVLAAAGEHAGVLRVPLHAGHGAGVVVEAGHGFTEAAELPQVPDLDHTIIAAGHKERVIPVPVDNIHIGGVGPALGEHAGLARVGPDVPDLDGLVTAAARHHRLLVGAPLDVLD